MERLQPKVGLLCPPIANPARSPRVEPMRKAKRSKMSWCTTSSDWEITLHQYNQSHPGPTPKAGYAKSDKVAHMTPGFAFTMRLAIGSRRTNTRASPETGG